MVQPALSISAAEAAQARRYSRHAIAASAAHEI